MHTTFSLSTGKSVDIHLTNGVMARGVITATNEKLVVLEKRPALHSQHGTKPFEKIYIDRNHIVTVGFNDTSK